MIKAIVFDIGGVLVDLDFNQALNSFKKKAGFTDIEEFLDPWKQKGFFSDLEEGLMSEEDFVKECLKHCRPGLKPEVLEECLEDFVIGMHPAKAQIIKELQCKYDLYLLSNNNPLSMRCVEKILKRRGIDMNSCFKKRFISCEMKMVKPNADIFLATIDSIGCKPEEILFIDDSTTNIAAAANLGIDARLCSGVDDFFAIFASLI